MDEILSNLEIEFLWRSMSADIARKPSRITADLIRAELIWVTTQIHDLHEMMMREQEARRAKKAP